MVRVLLITILYIITAGVSSIVAQTDSFLDIIQANFKVGSFTCELEYKIKSTSTGDTNATIYFADLEIMKDSTIAYAVRINDSLEQIYMNGILLNVNKLDSTYVMQSIGSKALSAQKKYLYRPIVDSNFVNILEDDTKIEQIRKDSNASYYTVVFSDTEELDTVYYKISISRSSPYHVIGYSLHASIVGINLFESWTLLDLKRTSSINQQLQDKFFHILGTFNNAQNLSPNDSSGTPDSLDIISYPGIVNMNLETLSGIKLDSVLKTLNSKYYLVDFWYMACPPCIESIPAIKRLHSSFDINDLAILSINLVDHNQDMITKYLEHNELPFQTYFKNGAEEYPIDAYISSYPTFLLLNENGELVERIIGHSESLFSDIEALIRLD
jgi:thiol-disulfide isomerase/thioredoxin